MSNSARPRGSAQPGEAGVFLAPADGTDRGRIAALRLHGLNDADRAWLIARLAPAQQRRVRGWLEELRTLGVPAEAGREIAMPSPPQSAPTTAAAEDPLQRIAAASADAIFERLRGEPRMLSARLLALHAWPWARVLRERLQRAHAEPLAVCEPIAPDAWTDLDRSLLRHLARGLVPASASGSHTEAARGAWLAHWRRRLTR